METLSRYMAVAVGGALGAMLRFYLGSSVLARVGAPFPTATFFINITGSFIVGFFLTLATERFPISPYLRLGVAVGFVGAYTTFSTFEYETARLVEERDFIRAFLNVVLSFVVGFMAVWGGIIAARIIEGTQPTSHAAYDRFERQADPRDPAQMPGTERDIRDSTIQADLTKTNKTGNADST
ncbi:MAG TPA: fluoride efflux transporter CrcB [Pyrinomonadaceae bacterium]|nr:fluoride efflux transporter CrcB [Pyrinomonadaceae bacterium]